jgi:hypothetical protein
MGWVKLDDAVGEHPKIASLSDTAFALWVAGLAYCNRNLTDGFIPENVGYGQLRYCGGNTVPFVRELESAGLWDPILGGWQVHDFTEYQPTKAQILAEREATRERVRKHRGNAPSNDASNGVGNDITPGTGMGEVDLSKQGLGFGDFWAAYPIHRDKAAAKVAWDKAVRLTPAEVIIAGALAYRDDPNRDPGKTKYAQGWLNGKRWEDDPIPSNNGRARTRDIPALALRKIAERNRAS